MSERILKKVEVRNDTSEIWKDRFFVADLGDGTCIVVNNLVTAVENWINNREMTANEFIVWSQWREIPESKIRFMTEQEIFTALKKGAILMHNPRGAYLNYWDSEFNKEDYSISYNHNEYFPLTKKD